MAPPHCLRTLIVSGCALLAFGPLQPCPAQSGKAAPKPNAKPAGLVREKTAKATSPLQIAVVDIERARAGHPLYQIKSRQLVEWRRAELAELQKLEKDIEARQTQLKNTVQPGTEAAENLAGEIQDLGFRHQRKKKWLLENSVHKRNEMLLELHKQVLDAILELAPKRGIDLVLRRREPPAKAPLSAQMEHAMSSDVLYASAALDITEDVIDFLKTKYPPK